MTVRARVKPEMIRWVRMDADLSIEVAAKKTGTSEAVVRRWEEGSKQPTIRQLRLLGNVTKRPLAVFYLAAPPRDFDALRDFRRLPGTSLTDQSPALGLAMRLALQKRDVALALATDLGEVPPPLPIRASVGEPVAGVARRTREFLGISLEEQQSWKGKHDALNGWRRAVHDRGILVFQARGVEVSEMRGFSAADEPMPTIVLNVKDAPNGRVFTLVHEFCHLLLRKGGICALRHRGDLPPEANPVEVFCNSFAGEVLVPATALKRSPVLRGRPPRADWRDTELQAIAKEFSVSKAVVLGRLLDTERISRAVYESLREGLFRPSPPSANTRRSGFASPSTSAVSNLGHVFVKLVLTSYYQERITSRDVSEHLGVRLKHLPKIEQKVMGTPVLFS